ncbi:MAG: FAD-dependent oxidoreductase, partial [Gammaproteobacteria bacterium]|nr:FAD-dependent oxidoreductase [Gammaproteobacteria bacterium]
YYKTFMWPQRGWMLYERLIRRAAGLGRAPELADPDRYEKTHRHVDVLVVGAGPAGLSAALAAGRAGAEVLLVDEQCEPGGWLLVDDQSRIPALGAGWLDQTLRTLSAMDNVQMLTRTTACALYDHNYLTLLESCSDHLPPTERAGRIRQRLWKVRTAQLVLATGAHERPLVFDDNDRPGVMLASAAACYARRYAVLAGQRVVLACNNNLAYASAALLAAAGAELTLLDARAEPPRDRLRDARAAGIRVLSGSSVERVLGRTRVRGARIGSLTGRGRHEGLDCDLVLMSGGFNPVLHLYAHAGGKLLHDAKLHGFMADPRDPDRGLQLVGAAAGHFDYEHLLRDAEQVGRAAARAATGQSGISVFTPSGFVSSRDAGGRPEASSATTHADRPAPAPDSTLGLEPLWQGPGTRFGKRRFVDYQNDVTAADLRLAAREGYLSIEHAKRYTTAGMGTDQGKTGNVNALALLGQASGRTPAAVGTTTFRPPYTPLSFGALAGRDIGELSDPARLTPMHDWHVQAGARFEDVGQWKRPWYYPRRIGSREESMHEAVNRECLAVRHGVGILDASTLGRIELHGPDTPELLNRVYCNGFRTLTPGRCRYGLMCREDGMVFDDGVTARLDERRWLMHTTTGNAARVLAWLEEWLQTEWPQLQVYCTSVSEQWATASLSGPLARELLIRVGTDIDLSPTAFPFMSCRTGTLAGLDARVLRVSFTGELCYEINVAAHQGTTLWQTLMDAGQPFGITPFGTETMHVLRAEKGFIIAGQDTDGTVTPIDLGLGNMVSPHKDFLGKRSLQRPHTRRADRKQLVGLLTEDPRERLPEGAQLVQRLGTPPLDMHGHVTSSYWSATLGRSIALGLVRGGHGRLGERLLAPTETGVIAARIAPICFYDPQGERMRG